MAATSKSDAAEKGTKKSKTKKAPGTKGGRRKKKVEEPSAAPEIAEIIETLSKAQPDGKTCILCGGPIMPLETANGEILKYCSQHCASVANEWIEYKRIMRETKDGVSAYCEYCGKEYVKKNYGHRHCSYECQRRANAVASQKRCEEKRAESDEHVRVCKQCGAFFDARTDRGEFCGLNCSRKWSESHTAVGTEENRKEIAAELALNKVLETGKTHGEIAEQFGVSADAIRRVSYSKEYIDSTRHFARLLAANVQGQTMKNLLGIANMEIDPDDKDVGKKLAVKSDANKFLLTRIFESAHEDAGSAGNKSAPITIIYQMTPDSPQGIEENLVYIDESESEA
jgi:hypothetical protein